MLALDASGAYRWHTFYGCGFSDEARGIAVDGDGRVYFTGKSYQGWNGDFGASPLHAFGAGGQMIVLKLGRTRTYLPLALRA